MDGAIARPRQAPAAFAQSIEAITRQKLSNDGTGEAPKVRPDIIAFHRRQF